jgi:hypothetical protein
MLTAGEAEAREPDRLAVHRAIEASRALAKRQAGIAAERLDVPKERDRRSERYLMWPVAIDGLARQLAFAADHGDRSSSAIANLSSTRR